MNTSIRLTSAAFSRAAAFLHSSDPLHAALLAFHFENASPDTVTRTLAPFQNTDGGFGGLEPDIGFTTSSTLSTCAALHHLADLGSATDHPLVRRAFDYLNTSFDATQGTWRIIPAHDNTAPHAPWWHDSPELAPNFGHFLDNPRADVLACFYRFRSPQTDALREHVTMLVLERLSSLGDAVEMHALVCYVRLHRAPGLPPPLVALLEQRLPAWIEHAVECDPAQWGGYGLRPLDVAPTSDSPWRALLGAAIDANLDFLLTQQADDGSWSPHWSWGNFFPEVWPAAKRRWQAILTLAALRTLRSYGRLAP